jgi:hypothetical protein
MAYTMLRLYDFDKQLNDDFNISFEIPDNCNYVFSQNNGEYYIKIKLNTGQAGPSKTFVKFTEKATPTNQVLITNFEQYEKSGVIIKKPKGTIEL